MLLEAFKYLTTPCPRPVRKMGYLKEMIGLASRRRRCLNAWRAHLSASRGLIVEAAASRRQRRRVVVLGSGLLYDIPLDILADLFDQVVLVDIVHMPAVRRAAGRFANVVLRRHDIAAVVEPIFGRLGKTLPMPAADLPLASVDLVVSANVVSQLPVIPAQYAARAGDYSAAELSLFSKNLIERHLAALADFPAAVCLITEVEQLTLAGVDTVARHDPLLGLKVPSSLAANCRSWDWHFAPRPERHKNYDLRYRVEGFIRDGT